jgi:hypothetical protein
MLHLRKLRLAGLIGLALAGAISAAAAGPREEVLVQWQFDKPGDFRGWTPNSQVADAAVRRGALQGRATGNDPILVGPVCEFPAAVLQRVEIRMLATAKAPAELFWTETLQGQFGGFSGTKHHAFHTVGDGQFHVYRLYPFWHAAKKIVRLRVDPPSDGRFQIEWIRVVQEKAAATAPAQAWNAAQFRHSWRAAPPAADAGDAPLFFSPPLAIPTAENLFISLRVAADRPASARVFCVSRDQCGWDSTAIPLQPDGKPHTYNVDGGALKTWHGQIVLLALQFPPSTKAGDGPQNHAEGPLPSHMAEGSFGVRLESIEVAPEPRGPVELEIAYFGPSEGVNRAGRAAGVSCMLRNHGGAVAENVVVTLDAPPGVQMLSAARQTIDRLSLDLPKSVSWQILAGADKRGQSPFVRSTLRAVPANGNCPLFSGRIDLKVHVQAGSQPPLASCATIELTPAPSPVKAAYVPEPKPVPSKFEVGTYYFPGWCTPERWQPIRDWPLRKPVLGWYDEANPECADWQIKWAVEHGIRFFMVDWYWNQGAQHLDHWVHNAYAKARYRDYLKWAVMWANHNPPHSNSVDDWRRVTQYWIDHYFSMPGYYRIDDRPAVFFWSPQNLARDVGGVEPATALYAMSQQMAKAAGYRGIYFVAMSSHDSPERIQELKHEGFAAETSYHAFQLAWQQTGSDYFPYASVVDTSPTVWRQEDQRAQGLPYFPVVDTGWDPRPWHGNKTMVALDRTPQLLGKLCRDARQYAEQTGKKIIALGPWNEWGEGSYIEPYAQYGFQDLDQIRAAFCEPGDWPPNLIPADVGLGPYDLPAPQQKTAWEFNTDGDLEGWTSNSHVAGLEVKGGSLRGRSTGYDPLLIVAGLQVEALRLHHLRFRFRADTPGKVQLFWATTMAKMSNLTNIDVDVAGDGQFHEYDVDLAKNLRWRGLVKEFRFDPAVRAGVKFEIDYIRLH